MLFHAVLNRPGNDDRDVALTGFVLSTFLHGTFVFLARPFFCFFKPSSNSVLFYRFSTFQHSTKQFQKNLLVVVDLRLCCLVFFQKSYFLILAANVLQFCKFHQELRPWLTNGKPLGPVRLPFRMAFIHTNNMTTCARLCCRGHAPLTFILERCTLDRRCCLFPQAIKR